MDDMIIKLLGVVGGTIAIVAPIIKLNISITRLNTTVENLVKRLGESNNSIKEHESILNNHEVRIAILEDKK